MKNKFARLGMALVLVAVVMIGVYLFNDKKPKEINSRTIKVGYNPESYNQGPLIIAQEKKFFADNGINIELVPMKGGKEIKQALSTGKLDIGLGGASNFIPLISKGAPIKIIAPINLSPAYVFVRPNTLTSFKDLEGKMVGSTPGGASEVFFKDALKKEGVNPDDVKYDPSDSSLFAIALMEKKSLDAVIDDEQEYSNYLKAGAIVLPEWESKGYAGPRVPRSVIAANTDFLSANKDLANALLDAVIDGHRFISDHKTEAATIMANHCNTATKGATSFTAEEIEKAWDTKRNVFVIWHNTDEYVEVSDELQEIGDVDKKLYAEDIFDMSFRDKLIKAQNSVY